MHYITNFLSTIVANPFFNFASGFCGILGFILSIRILKKITARKHIAIKNSEKIVNQLIELTNKNAVNWIPDDSYNCIPNIDHSSIDFKKSAFCSIHKTTLAYLITIESETYLFITIDLLKSIPRFITSSSKSPSLYKLLEVAKLPENVDNDDYSDNILKILEVLHKI